MSALSPAKKNHPLRARPGSRHPWGTIELPDGVEILERFGTQARRLWDRCRGDWGVSIIRDDEGELRDHGVYHFGNGVMPNRGLLVDGLVSSNKSAGGRSWSRRPSRAPARTERRSRAP